MTLLIYFSIAVIFLFVGHIVRAVRWAMLFPRESVSRPSHLFLALSLSYLLNILLPYRLGEFAKILYVSDREKIRLAPVISSVLVERLTDCIILILIGVFAKSVLEQPSAIPTHTISIVVVVLLLFAMAIHSSQKFRSFIWKTTWIFNERVRLGCAEIAWTFSNNLKGGVIYSGKYLLLTLLMCCSYGMSYYFIARILTTYTTLEIFELILETSGSLMTKTSMIFMGEGLLFIYLITPPISCHNLCSIARSLGLPPDLGSYSKG